MKHSKLSEPETHKSGSVTSIILLILIAVTLGVVVYLLLQPGPSATGSSISSILLAVLGLTVLVLIWFMVWEFSIANRLRRMLKKTSSQLETEPTDIVKAHYLKIYDLYMKLPEKKKQNFYSRVNALRERLEEQLQAEKELERLLAKSDKGSIADQKKIYLSLFAKYEKLPRSVQHQYYPQIVQLRDRLERGH